jgi:hypothetical protein
VSFRATGPDDFAAIADLATDVFQLEHENPFRDRNYQEWKYWRPHADWNGSRSYVTERDGKMVAHGCTWPMRFQTVEREWSGQYLIDWAAAATAPGAGIALLRRTAAMVDGVCAIGGSEMTRAIMPKIGFRPFNTVWLGARPLRPILQARSHQFRNWKLPLRLVRNTLWSVWPRLPSSNGWSARECPPSELPPDLWPRPFDSVAVCGRSAAQFEFLLACPAVRFTFYVLTREGKPAGYFCLASIHHQIRIVDLWTPRPDVSEWTAAYAMALRTAARIPGAAEAVAMSSLPVGQQALLRCGFRIQVTLPVMLYGSRQFLSAAESFHIQMADCDFGFVHGNGAEYRT